MKNILTINLVGKSNEEIEKLPKAYSSRAVLFDERGNVVLMSCDSEKKNTGQYYGLPGGHIEEGETPEVSCKREIREESGFEITEIIPIGTIAFVKEDSVSVSYGFTGQVVSSNQKELQLTDIEKFENHATLSLPFEKTVSLLNTQYTLHHRGKTLRNLTFILEAKRLLKKQS